MVGYGLELVRSLGAERVIDYSEEDSTCCETRYDIILDNVMNHPPSATVKVLTTTRMLIPISIGNTGGIFVGLLRMGWAGVMGRGSTDAQGLFTQVVRRYLTKS